MASAKDAKIQFEAGQTPYAMAPLTGSGVDFVGAAAPWSRRSGYEPEILVDGLLTGGKITAHATENTVAIAGGTAYISGKLVSFLATTKTVGIGSEGTAARISSVIVDEDGAVSVEDGTVGAALIETRNVGGGPAYVPVDAIEIGQVRRAVIAAAPVTAAQIFQTPGIHQEFFNVPARTGIDYLTGTVSFAAPFAAIHTAAAAKKVYAAYATPIFADVPKASAWQDPAYTYSISSTEYYGGAEGSESRSIGQGGFSALLEDGTTDPIIQVAGEKSWFKFWPDRARSVPYRMALGTLGAAVAYPASGAIAGTFTISAESPSVGVVA